MNKDEIKELNVNGRRAVRYVVGNRLYMKVDAWFLSAWKDAFECERACIHMIEHFERRRFAMVSYLNIE